jgi:AraC-like DNA-binding protein
VRHDWVRDLIERCQAFVRRVEDSERDELPAVVSTLAAGLPVPESPAEDVLLRDRVFASMVAAGIHFHQRYHRTVRSKGCTRSPVESAAPLLDPLHELRRDVAVADVIDRWAAAYLAVFDRHHPWPAAARAAGLVRKNPGQPLTTAALARVTGTSRSGLTRDFRRFYGMSIGEYRMRVRIRSILQDLRAPGSNIDALTRESGYRSAKSFYAAVRALTGLTPAGIRGLSERALQELLQDGLHVPQGLAESRRVGRNQ